MRTAVALSTRACAPAAPPRAVNSPGPVVRAPPAVLAPRGAPRPAPAPRDLRAAAAAGDDAPASSGAVTVADVRIPRSPEEQVEQAVTAILR